MELTLAAQTLTWEAAQAAAVAALRHAQGLCVKVNVAVVDRCGTPAAFLRMPGAPLHSIGIAEDKAYTAASFGIPTSGWDRALGDDPALKAGLARRPRLVMFGGGLPLRIGGECVGGIGVSGASEAQDEACARAGLAALGLD